MVDYLNVPEEMLDRPIEPWAPKVGDRVRVRVSPECGWVSPVSYWDAESNKEVSLGEGRFGHAVSEENGRVGTIERRLSAYDYAPPHHSWLVRWDACHPDLGWFCTPLATWEIEPLTEEAH